METSTVLKQSEINDLTLAQLVELGEVEVFDVYGVSLTPEEILQRSYPYFCRKYINNTISLVLYGLDVTSNSKGLPNLDSSITMAIQRGYVCYESSKYAEFNPPFSHPITGFKWIHSIQHLKKSLNNVSDLDLCDKGYDVEDYYLYNVQQSEKGSLAHLTWIAANGCAYVCVENHQANYPNPTIQTLFDEVVKMVEDNYGRSHILFLEIVWVTYKCLLKRVP